VSGALCLLPVSLLLLALLLWQILEGKVLGPYWEVWVVRQRNPRKFWGIIAAQTLVIALPWALLLVI